MAAALSTAAAGYAGCASHGSGSLDGILDASPGDSGNGGEEGTLTSTACASHTDCRQALGTQNTICVYEVGVSCGGAGGRCYKQGDNLPACAAFQAQPEVYPPDMDCDGNFVASFKGCHGPPKGYGMRPLKCQASDPNCDVPRPGKACSAADACGDQRLTCAYREDSDTCSTQQGTCIWHGAVEACQTTPTACACDGGRLTMSDCLQSETSTWLTQPANPAACAADAGTD